MFLFNRVFLFFAIFILNLMIASEGLSENFDLKYELNDILRSDNNSKISNVSDWQNIARPRILKAVDTIYGLPPNDSEFEIFYEILEQSDNALNGLAKRIQYRIKIVGSLSSKSIDLLVYVPKNAALPAPAFFAISSGENLKVINDFSILPSLNNKDSNSEILKMRGVNSKTWCVEDILKRGYAFAIFDTTSVFEDSKNGSKNSIYTISKNQPDIENQSAISAWAWSAKIAFNALKKIKDIDSNRIAIIGHSRFGKTALIASARYNLFKITILNNSGCMGAALSRRASGETVEDIAKAFPYWFSKNLKNYAKKEYNLPTEQSEIIALIAPKAVYVASASKDDWADPQGEFLSLIEASKVYALYLKFNFPKKSDFKIGNVFFGDCAWHLRAGEHALTNEDWGLFIDFADKYMFDSDF